MSEQNIGLTDQNIILEGRARINISGVKDVVSFDDETVLLSTALGRLAVKGENLHIVSFHTETGELTAEGKIHAAIYMGDTKNGGFINRLLK